MDILDGTVLLLGKVLHLCSARHEILAANTANADIPGYRGVDLVFEEELTKAVRSARGFGLAKTHSKHFPQVRSLNSVTGRVEPTGATYVGGYLNSFNIEQEMVRLAEVRVVDIVTDGSLPKISYDPNHPDANASGYVAMPNINVIEEMVNMLCATRSYEANVTAIQSAKGMDLKALEIGRYWGNVP